MAVALLILVRKLQGKGEEGKRWVKRQESQTDRQQKYRQQVYRKKTNRERVKQIDRTAGRQAEMEKVGKRIGRQAGRQTDRQTDRQAGRQAGRRQKKTDILYGRNSETNQESKERHFSRELAWH